MELGSEQNHFFAEFYGRYWNQLTMRQWVGCGSNGMSLSSGSCAKGSLTVDWQVDELTVGLSSCPFDHLVGTMNGDNPAESAVGGSFAFNQLQTPSVILWIVEKTLEELYSPEEQSSKFAIKQTNLNLCLANFQKFIIDSVGKCHRFHYFNQKRPKIFVISKCKDRFEYNLILFEEHFDLAMTIRWRYIPPGWYKTLSHYRNDDDGDAVYRCKIFEKQMKFTPLPLPASSSLSVLVHRQCFSSVFFVTALAVLIITPSDIMAIMRWKNSLNFF